MSVALEFIDFIVPISTIREKYPGGWEQCLKDHSPLLGGRVWHDDHLLRNGGSGYLPRRHVESALRGGALHRVVHAPSFTRRVYVVENAQTVSPWGWYASALVAAASH